MDTNFSDNHAILKREGTSFKWQGEKQITYLSQNRRLRSARNLQFSPTATIPLFPTYTKTDKRNHAIETKWKKEREKITSKFLYETLTAYCLQSSYTTTWKDQWPKWMIKKWYLITAANMKLFQVLAAASYTTNCIISNTCTINQMQSLQKLAAFANFTQCIVTNPLTV